MSRRRRKRESPAPLSVAGLVRFFEEEVKGIKVRPEFVIFVALTLMGMTVLAHLGFFSP